MGIPAFISLLIYMTSSLQPTKTEQELQQLRNNSYTIIEVYGMPCIKGKYVGHGSMLSCDWSKYESD